MRLVLLASNCFMMRRLQVVGGVEQMSEDALEIRRDVVGWVCRVRVAAARWQF